mgnify:CR=1 FL=1
MGIPTRTSTAHLLTLTCPCGARLRGKVVFERATAAVKLFEAHHQGKRCAPTWGLNDMPMRESRSTPRLTPAMVCGSAWWLARP